MKPLFPAQPDPPVRMYPLWADDVGTVRIRCRSPKISKLLVFTGKPSPNQIGNFCVGLFLVYISNPVFVPVGNRNICDPRPSFGGAVLW